MPTSSKASEPASPRQAFTFYAANGHIYASNVKQKLIDLGSVMEDGGGYSYLLDGNRQSGQNLASLEAVLRHVADHIRFLYLDGQFTALADLRETGRVNLDGAAQIDVMIDELQSGEPIVDARV
jgi:hypothetical protein